MNAKRQPIARQSVAYRNLKKVAKPVVKADDTAIKLDALAKHADARFEMLAKRDEDATRRTRDHILWITVSLVISAGFTFVPAAFVIHFGAILAGSPAIATEIQNWIHRW